MDKIKTIIFDWDGTLHKTGSLYRRAVSDAHRWLVENGHSEPREITEETTNKYLGMTAAQMWEDFMPQLDADIKAQGEAIVARRMVELVREGSAVLYDGVAETLDALKAAGYELVILSNCKNGYIEAHREAFNLDKWFSAYYAAENYDFIPKEEIFEDIKKKHPGGYAVVGDRDSDMVTVKMHGLYGIGCLYGYGSRSELGDADVLIDDIRDIKNIWD